MFAAARGQTKQPAIPHVAVQPAAIVHRRQGVVKVPFAGRFGVEIAPRHAFIPGATVLFEEGLHEVKMKEWIAAKWASRNSRITCVEAQGATFDSKRHRI